MTREEAIKFLKSGCLTLACEHHVKNRCNADYREKEAKKDEALKMAIESLESKWIPCSERLPKPYELVLIQNIHGVMSIASRIGKKWFNFQGIELWEAVAWQPLPEPYKEGDT